jgi:mannosyl-oligosaccharide glucosidase
VRVTASLTAEAEAAEAAAEPRPPRRRVALVFYIADEGEPSEEWRLPITEPGNGERRLGAAPRCLAAGGHASLGAWSLHAASSGEPGSCDGAPGARVNFLAGPLQSAAQLAEASNIVVGNLRAAAASRGAPRGLRLTDHAMDAPTMALFQLTLDLPGSYDFLYLSGEGLAEPGGGSGAAAERLAGLSGAGLTRLLDEKEREFDARFERTFLSRPADAEGTAGASPGAGAGGLDQPTLRACQAALSNLLGGVGYFHGSSEARRGCCRCCCPPGSDSCRLPQPPPHLPILFSL